MIAIADTRIPKSAADALEMLGADILRVPKNPRLAEPVSAHPDMRMMILGKKIFIPKNEARELSHITQRLEKADFETVMCDISLCTEYPRDIAFNCSVIGNRLLGKLDFTAPEIIAYAEEIGMELINVKQGYAKCSTLAVDENSAITADPSIAYACEKLGIDVLKIDSNDGDIILEGYSKGFIGGASGVLGERVFFCGDLESHPDGNKIRKFCEGKGKTVLSLGNERLFDIGSLFLLDIV